MRHAKAVPMGLVDDVDRPLSQRGFADSEAAALWLDSQPWRIDEALVSAALRTSQTFETLSRHLTYSIDMRPVQEFYEASAGEILAHVQQASAETLLVVAHSPGIPRLAVGLALGDVPSALESARGYPTAAISVLESPLPWAQWEPETADFVTFHVPRADAASVDRD